MSEGSSLLDEVSLKEPGVMKGDDSKQVVCAVCDYGNRVGLGVPPSTYCAYTCIK